MEQKTASKKEYVKPAIEDHGNVAVVTSVGNTQPDTDMRGGSVFPPGHDKAPPFNS